MVQKASRSNAPATEADAQPESGRKPREGRGNSFRQERLQGGGEGSAAATSTAEEGPTADGQVNQALALAFGQPLAGLSARWGAQSETASIGAEAATQGSDMAFGAGVDQAAQDPQSAEIVAHEVAHALAGGGTGKTPIDQPGDPGERGADEAGSQFRKWAERGYAGSAPRLRPAHGGQAEVHRYSKTASVIDGYPQLRRGSSGNLVKTLQWVLNTYFGFSLDIDGQFGPRTQSAVTSFQSSHGLDADGIVGPLTAAKLNSGGGNSGGSSGGSSSGSALDGDPMLKMGSKGSTVKTLQTRLNHYGASLSVDGEFGSKTYTAVVGFQSANGLEVDGIVGPKTAAKLNSNDAKKIGAGGSNGGGSNFEPSSYSSYRDMVIGAAQSHMGAPYWWGADGPKYFDCSGFVLYVLRQDTGLINWGDDTAHGIRNRLPQTSNPQKGDMAFLWSGGSVEHIEIMMGSGTKTIACGGVGAGRNARGDIPTAKVQYDDLTRDSRSATFGSISGLIAAKTAKS